MALPNLVASFSNFSGSLRASDCSAKLLSIFYHFFVLTVVSLSVPPFEREAKVFPSHTLPSLVLSILPGLTRPHSTLPTLTQPLTLPDSNRPFDTRPYALHLLLSCAFCLPPPSSLPHANNNLSQRPSHYSKHTIDGNTLSALYTNRRLNTSSSSLTVLGRFVLSKSYSKWTM